MSSTLKTIFRIDPTTDVTSTYNILSTLTSAHTTTIVTRWRKKTVALRAKCLSRAWEALNGSVNKNILERHPRLSDIILEAKSLSELEIDKHLYACINTEQLATNPAALLNLVCSRAVRHPSVFGRWDYRWSVKPVLEMFGLIGEGGQRKGKVDVVVIAGSEDEYGALKSYSGRSRDYNQGVERMLICPLKVEGTYLMRWQKTILEFCLAVVRDIISPIDPKKENPVTDSESVTATLLKNVPNYSLSGGDLESYCGSVLLRPYIIPPDLSIEDILQLAISHLRAAEDHQDLLHTSPNYFISQVENQLTLTPENMPVETPLAVHDALRRALFNAYTASLLWSHICFTLEDSKLRTESKHDLFITISPLLTLLGASLETALRLHFLAARESKTDNVVNSLLMCLRPSDSPIYPNWLTLPRIAVEIERALADSPLLKSQIDPWVMNILSSIAAISEVHEAICQLEPSSGEDNQASTNLGDTVQTLSQLWEKVDLGSFSNVSELQESIADDGLVRFWEHVSEEFVRFSGYTLAEWILSKQGGVVNRGKKGRWHWQGNVWVSDKIENDKKCRNDGDKLPELIGIAEWDDIDGYGEPRPTHSNGGGAPKMAETLTNMQEGDVQFAMTRRGVKRIISDVRGVKPDPTKKISVTKRMHSSITQLSNGTPLPWKDFVHLMTNLGFTIEHIGGTLVRLIPATERDEAMVVQRPHRHSTLQSLECLSIWARLEKCYGWKVGIFEKEANAAEAHAAA